VEQGLYIFSEVVLRGSAFILVFIHVYFGWKYVPNSLLLISLSATERIDARMA
jgi:hypothetical protein